MPRAPQVILADFETKGIQSRPKYPPKPGSLALKWPDQSDYKLMAWGHGDGTRAFDNNCTEKEARGELKKAQESKYPVLWQNEKFDLDVAEIHWELPIPDWRKRHDTMYLLFLENPHAPSLALKESAQRILGIAPEEQDKLKEWILANIEAARKKPSTWGAYICEAPYRIVKPYHKGDLTRMGRLFNKIYPYIVESGMLEAYQRELKLMPILLENERVGMRVDMNGLERDLPAMIAGVEKTDVWLRKKLGIENIDSDRQLGEALYNKGIVSDFKKTAKGHLSVSKKTLTLNKFKDPKVYQALQYRGQMSTSISMFIKPWLELGTAGKGTIHPNWSQVRSPKGNNDTGGARSGRIICSKPNFLNIPKKWKRAASAGYVHPAFLKVPELPYVRSYCLPDKGQRWGKRDFDQQELRLFGHFEEGPVMAGFLSAQIDLPCSKCGAPVGKQCVGGKFHAERKYDIHELVRAEVERRLIEACLREGFDRDTAKSCVFGRLYGQGITGLMQLLQLLDEEKPIAQIIQASINAAVPSIKELDNRLKALSDEGLPIRTFGSRLYYCEEPKYSPLYGRDMTFSYKLLNYLMQGSGADVTKETLIRYNEAKKNSRFVVTVYDEVNFSAPAKAMKEEQKIMQDCMRSIATDVPMLSEGESGVNWGTLTKWQD
jgi:DNA polymerase I-like protein with 3'-5' exonuclease and polymerase domains